MTQTMQTLVAGCEEERIRRANDLESMQNEVRMATENIADAKRTMHSSVTSEMETYKKTGSEFDKFVERKKTLCDTARFMFHTVCCI